MSDSVHDHSRKLIERFRSALYDLDTVSLRAQLADLFVPDALIQLAHPLGTMTGPDALFEQAYAPLIAAIPDLERRDYIVKQRTTRTEIQRQIKEVTKKRETQLRKHRAKSKKKGLDDALRESVRNHAG